MSIVAGRSVHSISTNFGRASPAFSAIATSADESRDVGCRLIMIKGTLRPRARRGSIAAGMTLRDEPTTRNRSHAAASSLARVSSASGTRWPNKIVAALRKPPQAGQSGSTSPASMRSCSSVMEERAPQIVQAAAREVPCSSMTRSALLPASWCRPSKFCVMTPSNNPLRSKSARARWAALGRASFTLGESWRRVCQ